MRILTQLRSWLGAAPPEPLPVPLEALPTAQLQASYAAGQAMQAAVASLAAEGLTVLDVVMNGNPYAAWEMYPWQGGILDQRHNSQFFYHAHDDYLGEHGHFHTFVYHQRKLVHLVALGMDADGRINRLYTFNRWGPGDHYFPAEALKTLLPHFRIGPGGALDPRLHAFVNAALVLFRAEIEQIFDLRDTTFARYRARHNGASPFEDRSLEITSDLPADVPAHMAFLKAELTRRGAPLAAGGADGAGAGNGAADGGSAGPAADDGAEAEAAAEALGARSLAERSSAQLLHSLEAGLALRVLTERLHREGRSAVEVVMNGKAHEPWEMYPWQGGVVDPETGGQYFYHAHPQSPEHGHFHLFAHPDGNLAHLVAVAMDNHGTPISLFTVNRWVTGDVTLPAERLQGYVPMFRVETDAFDRTVGAWLRQLLLLYEPEIATLLEVREGVFAAYRDGHGGRAPDEDRDLEVTSTLEIDVEAHIARLEAELHRRGAR